MKDRISRGLAEGGTVLVAGLVDTFAVERARSVHDAYPTASAALGRLLSGALLLASGLKEGQKVFMQVSGDGPLGEIVAEADWLCRARGYVKRPHIHLPLKNGKLDVGGAVGSGFLNVIKDLGLKDPYRGTVAIQSGEIAEDIAYYLNVSEQVPSVVSLGVFVDRDNSVKASGGFMIQALPEARDETIDYLEDRMKNLRPVSSMVLEGMGPEEIMEEAAGLPVKAIDSRDVSFYCPCGKQRVLDAITALGARELEGYARRGEPVEVVCRFCKTKYSVTGRELAEVLKGLGGGGGRLKAAG